MSSETPGGRNAHQCLACGRSQEQVPLVSILYRDRQHWICPQHLPLLIHDPSRLAGKLEGAERMVPADHHD